MQFVLPVTWSYGQKYGITLEQLVSWWSERPAKLAGQHSKVNFLKLSFYICISIDPPPPFSGAFRMNNLEMTTILFREP